ncbi:hypothetical protein Tco_0125675, partial [Tanacetum coccineum]
LVDLIRDLVLLLDSTPILSKATNEGENVSTQENVDSEFTIPDLVQGEQHPNNIPTKPANDPKTAEEANADAQGEQSSEQAPPISTDLVTPSLCNSDGVKSFL